MKDVFNDTAVKYTLGSRILSAMSVFFYSSLEPIVTWLIVMFAVIICDFIAGSRKSLIMGKPFRLSRAMRATMGKCCTYFSFVIASVFVEKAICIEGVAKWSIIVVCAGEFFSIINNILRPRGIKIDFLLLMKFIGSKFGKVDGVDKVFTKIDDDGKD